MWRALSRGDDMCKGPVEGGTEGAKVTKTEADVGG